MKLESGLFRTPCSSIKPARGCLLVSEPLLTDSYFQRSVIFLIEHNAEGTMGLVLNKPSGLVLNRLVEGLEELTEIPVFCGGPMSGDRLYYLHTLGHLVPNAIAVGKGLYIVGDFDVIVSYLRSGNNIEHNIKFFIGYSGWSSGQLSEEIEERVWAVNNNYFVEQCISQEGDLFWRMAVEGLGDEYRTWLNYPKLPYLN